MRTDARKNHANVAAAYRILLRAHLDKKMLPHAKKRAIAEAEKLVRRENARRV